MAVSRVGLRFLHQHLRRPNHQQQLPRKPQTYTLGLPEQYQPQGIIDGLFQTIENAQCTQLPPHICYQQYDLRFRELCKMVKSHF